MFFAYYIADFSRAWDFLYPYFNPGAAPEHLMLSIDAVSLAFLAHHIASPSARNLGRKKYVSALKKTNAALRNTKTAREASTLQASLILDLFENITNPASKIEDTRRAHVNGALALVKLRGLEHFRDSAGLKALTRLSLNAVVCCISQNDPVPAEIFEIREHNAQFVDVSDPKWRMTGLVLDMTDLVAEMTQRSLKPEEKVRRCIELDMELERVALGALPFWSYKRVEVPVIQRDGRALDDFYDVYPDRKVTQMWNVLRLLRILLCEEVVETCSDWRWLADSQRAAATIGSAIVEICASVPQMTDCDGAARHKLPAGTDPRAVSAHAHTLTHFLDAYVLIFALYVACWSRNCPPRAREWIIGELGRIAEHFGVREAAAVVEILNSQVGAARVGPWDVYRLLGSYAFAA